MEKTIFIDIDTQNDFILNNGALTAKAEDIIPALRRITEFAAAHGIPILASQDTHTPDDPEFADFPPHCVKGTAGYAKINETTIPEATRISMKPEAHDWKEETNKHIQMIFEKNNLDIFTNPNFEKAMMESSAGKYIVYGIATEYCVKIVVMGLLKRGKKTAVVTDAIKAIDRTAGKTALDEMAAAGAQLVTIKDIID